MCDYSLQSVKSRAANVGDKLITSSFGTGTVGFADVADNTPLLGDRVAVCLLPGTEVAFDDMPATLILSDSPSVATATFRQMDKDNQLTHHDALEFADGKVFKLNSLIIGQKLSVLQLPAAPRTEAEAQEQTRLEIVG